MRDRTLENSRKMAGENDEPESAATRLEAALERIATAAARRASVPDVSQSAEVTPGATQSFSVGVAVDPEITTRLDGLIERLRGALAVRPG